MGGITHPEKVQRNTENTIENIETKPSIQFAVDHELLQLERLFVLRTAVRLLHSWTGSDAPLSPVRNSWLALVVNDLFPHKTKLIGVISIQLLCSCSISISFFEMRSFHLPMEL